MRALPALVGLVLVSLAASGCFQGEAEVASEERARTSFSVGESDEPACAGVAFDAENGERATKTDGDTGAMLYEATAGGVYTGGGNGFRTEFNVPCTTVSIELEIVWDEVKSHPQEWTLGLLACANATVVRGGSPLTLSVAASEVTDEPECGINFYPVTPGPANFWIYHDAVWTATIEYVKTADASA